MNEVRIVEKQEEIRMAIELKDLTRYYGSTRGIDGLNLQVRPGEVLGFLGPNGAGKTTTIRLLLGLIRPTRGTICILDKEIPKHFPNLRRQIGYLPGDLGLYPDINGREYLHHMLRLHNGHPSSSNRLKELTDLFRINFEKPIRTYSKGMRQILGIIQAFAHEPALVILDEPTTGLDPLNQERFYTMISQERAAGTTVFFSSHILSEVQQICDRVAMVRDGRLITLQEAAQYGAMVGKQVRILATNNLEQVTRELEDLNGAHKIAICGDAVEFRFTGAIGDLLQRIANIPIDDLICANPQIEEIFFDFYRE